MTLDVDVSAARGGFQVRAAFEAVPGQTVALLGPNGSGKSTLVATIAGLLPPVGGTVELDGVVLDDAEGGVHVPPERRPIGVMFQDLLLFPHLSAIDNVAFPIRARGGAGSEARERAADLLARLGVAARAEARPRDLSGGEAQRVALARALVAEPALLLLDEPLSALDVGARVRIRELVRGELARFPGVRIIVTHDPVEASTLCDRLVLVEERTRDTDRVAGGDPVGTTVQVCRGHGGGRIPSAAGSSPWRRAPACSSRTRVPSSPHGPRDPLVASRSAFSAQSMSPSRSNRRWDPRGTGSAAK